MLWRQPSCKDVWGCGKQVRALSFKLGNCLTCGHPETRWTVLRASPEARLGAFLPELQNKTHFHNAYRYLFLAPHQHQSSLAPSLTLLEVLKSTWDYPNRYCHLSNSHSSKHRFASWQQTSADYLLGKSFTDNDFLSRKPIKRNRVSLVVHSTQLADSKQPQSKPSEPPPATCFITLDDSFTGIASTHRRCPNHPTSRPTTYNLTSPTHKHTK